VDTPFTSLTAFDSMAISAPSRPGRLAVTRTIPGDKAEPTVTRLMPSSAFWKTGEVMVSIRLCRPPLRWHNAAAPKLLAANSARVLYPSAELSILQFRDLADPVVR
jgi:hypothetical protein